MLNNSSLKTRRDGIMLKLDILAFNNVFLHFQIYQITRTSLNLDKWCLKVSQLPYRSSNLSKLRKSFRQILDSKTWACSRIIWGRYQLVKVTKGNLWLNQQLEHSSYNKCKYTTQNLLVSYLPLNSGLDKEGWVLTACEGAAQHEETKCPDHQLDRGDNHLSSYWGCNIWCNWKWGGEKTKGSFDK